MAGKSSGPASVAEGLGNVLSAITDTMKAPDATQFAGELMKLQTGVLDLIHGGLNKAGGQQGAPAPGGAPPGAAPGGPPGAAPGGGGGLMGGLAGLQGGPPQGPSAAAGGGAPSSGSGMDPDALRQMAAMGADDS
jgi:hypothetical protein